MPSKAKLTPILWDEVLARSARGETSSDIAQFLLRDFGVAVDSSRIRRLVKKAREARADVAKEEIRAALRKTLLPALETITRAGHHAAAVESRLQKRAAELRKRKDDPEAADAALRCDSLILKAIDRQLTAAGMLMHEAGLDTPDQPGQANGAPSSAEKRAALLKRIEALAGATKAEPN